MAHNFKLVHQTLIISRISFEKKLVVGLVELHLLPLVPDSLTVRLNCKQSRIFEVLVNGKHTAEYEYCDPTLQVVPEDSLSRTLDTFQNAEVEAFASVDSDRRLGELTVYLPKQVECDVNNGQIFRLSVEFALHEPAGGLHFVLPTLDDGTLLQNAMHMFSYGTQNSSRLWFPCIDAFNELCTWKIEIAVDSSMTAISAGELVETTLSMDGKQKTFFYDLSVPTSACNIAIAVGPFECHIDPNMNEVRHYCLPHLMPLLKCTTASLYEAFEFYEEMLSVRYPYPSYKQVFVDEAYVESQAYTSMTIFNTNLLHSARIIDQNPPSRFEQALGIAQQFFGCFIARRSWYDAWLTVGISQYLAYQYLKTTFGNNEYRHVMSQMLEDVCDYEQNEAPIILDSSSTIGRAYFDINRPQTIPCSYMKAFTKKACLVLRMLENRLGKELLLQVFNKMLSLASLSSSSEFSTGMWDNIMLSTKSFTKSVFTVTGKDLEVFIDQWVYKSGCAYFNGNFVFNRKRNVVELELKQELTGKGILKYVGPLEVTIQELDGSFNHTFKIEENKTKFEITCHSKSRRHKKKKIPLMTGEEVDMDLTAMNADSPVLWLRIDPDMQVLRKVQWEQPDFMWQYQLRHERDVIAQSEAISALDSFPTPATRQTLTDIIDDDHCYYRVRMSSTHCLVKVANQMVSTWAGPPAMMNIYKKMFGSHSCPSIVRQHKFKNFQQYHLQRTIPVAMASLRNTHGICPSEVLKFILDLFRYSDNSHNKYSDCYYTASLVEAVTNTITPAIAVVSSDHQTLSNEAKLILEEVTRLLNLEKLLPSYKNVITISCLKCIRVLQQNGHLPSTANLFKNYAQYGMFIDVRFGALDIIAEFLKEGISQKPQLEFLFNIVERDSVPLVRRYVLSSLVKHHMAIAYSGSQLNTPNMVERLWKLMNELCGQDTTLCAATVELYFKLYGRKNPILTMSAAVTSAESESSRVRHDTNTSQMGNSDVDVGTSDGLNVANEVTIGREDGATHHREDGGDERKKKKKKNKKHKHKHKSDKKEREHGHASTSKYGTSSGFEPLLHTDAVSSEAGLVSEAMLELSELSSAEEDDI